MNRRSILTSVSVFVMLMVVLAACGGGSSAPTSAPSGGGGASSGDPTASAKSFFTALYTGQGNMADYVCSAGSAMSDGLKKAGDAMKTGLAASNATIDVSGLTFTVANQSGDTATVKVGGTLKVTASGASNNAPFPEVSVPLKNDNGWKICG